MRKRKVPNDVREAAERIVEKVTPSDYDQFYRGKRSKGANNSFLSWFTSNHFHESKDVNIRDARKVRAYLHNNQRGVDDFGPQIIPRGCTGVVLIVAFSLALTYLGYAKYKDSAFDTEEKIEELLGEEKLVNQPVRRDNKALLEVFSTQG